MEPTVKMPVEYAPLEQEELEYTGSGMPWWGYVIIGAVVATGCIIGGVYCFRHRGGAAGGGGERFDLKVTDELKKEMDSYNNYDWRNVSADEWHAGERFHILRTSAGKEAIYPSVDMRKIKYIDNYF